jgi:hypothetical protein
VQRAGPASISDDPVVVLQARDSIGVGEELMAEVLAQFSNVLATRDGERFEAQACGAEMPDGLWEGWIEFIPQFGGEPIRTQRETTQPNRADAVYWASGLTAIYLEGALDRALNPPVRRMPVPAAPAFAHPAPTLTEPVPAGGVDAVLDPFSVYEKGETILRKELGALSAWHLVNILRAYDLTEEPPSTLNVLPQAYLIDRIVEGVRRP